MKREFHIYLADGTKQIKDVNNILELLRKMPNSNIGFNIKSTDPIITQIAMQTACQGFWITEEKEPIQIFIAPSQIKSIHVVFEQPLTITK